MDDHKEYGIVGFVREELRSTWVFAKQALHRDPKGTAALSGTFWHRPTLCLPVVQLESSLNTLHQFLYAVKSSSSPIC
jgi:hypothetical protein